MTNRDDERADAECGAGGLRQRRAPRASAAAGHEAIAIAAAAAVVVGPGCTRRDLPAPPGLRLWVVEMAPGSTWPQVDVHPHGETYFVIDGEVIEEDRRYGAGTHVHFAAGSRHRPRTEHGVRLYGLNPAPAAAGAPAESAQVPDIATSS